MFRGTFIAQVMAIVTDFIITKVNGKIMHKSIMKEEGIRLNIVNYKKRVYVIAFKNNDKLILKKFIKI